MSYIETVLLVKVCKGNYTTLYILRKRGELMITPKKSLATIDVNEKFEKVATDIFRYVELGLIKPFDVTLYVKYLELYNPNQGYAYPTIYKLEVFLNCSRQSIVSANKRLEKCGLLIIKKHKNNNNIYFPLQPHSSEELYRQVPELFLEYEKRKAKIESKSFSDKLRFEDLFESHNNSD